MLLTIVIFIAVLAVLVLAHEVGHFVAAKKFGCRVEEFGFGFPPRIMGWQILKRKKLEKISETETVEVSDVDFKLSDGREILSETIKDEIREVDQLVEEKEKRVSWGNKNESFFENGGTIYSLNWIPLGGFVKIKGEDGENRAEPDSFGHKKIWQRAIILFAGVFMNFVLAGLILSFGLWLGSPQALGDDMGAARVKSPEIQIVMVDKNLPAGQAGIQLGDVILKIDGQEFKKIEDIQNYLNAKKDQEVLFTLRRLDQVVEVEAWPAYMESVGRAGIGVGLVETGIVSYPLHIAIYKGFESAVLITKEILWAFGGIIAQLFVGERPAVDVSGPVGIAVMTGQVARLGFMYLLQFIALLSLNLAIINFLPFPALDGGRFLFLIIEAIRRKPANQKIENAVHNVGFALLMVLVLFVTYRDVVHFGGGVLNKIF